LIEEKFPPQFGSSLVFQWRTIMPRVLSALPCTPEQREMLTSLARGKKIEARLKERARIVLLGIDGVGVEDTAKQMKLNKDTLSPWHCGFFDRWRGGPAGPA
jgi:hypothetical protein